MRRALLGGLLLAILIIVLAAASNVLALTVVWPALLAAAVMLVPGRTGATRVSAFLIGGAAGWIGYAVRVMVLPDIAVTPGLALAVAVLLVTAVATLSADRLPLWSGVAGIAAFSGVYEAAFVASPTLFMSQSVVALTTFFATGAVGALAGMVGRTLAVANTQPADAATAEGGAR